MKSILILLILLLISSSCAPPKEIKKHNELGVAGTFTNFNKQTVFKIKKGLFKRSYLIQNKLPQKHHYRLIVLLDYEQVAFKVDGRLHENLDISINRMLSKRFNFEVSDISPGQHIITTVLFQDIGLMKKSKKLVTKYNNVLDRAIINNINTKKQAIYPMQLAQLPNKDFNGIAFSKNGKDYYYPQLIKIKGKDKLVLDLAIASLHKDMDFISLVFVDGSPVNIFENKKYINGRVDQGKQILLNVAIANMFKPGIHRVDVLLIGSPYSLKRNLFEFTTAIKLSVQ